jgi:hypothetical protein
LPTGRESGSSESECVRVFESNACRLAAEGSGGAGLKTAARDGKCGAAGGGAGSRSQCTDAKRDTGEFDDREARGGESEEALAIFIEGEKTTMEAVSVGGKHGEWLGKIEACA